MGRHSPIENYWVIVLQKSLTTTKIYVYPEQKIDIYFKFASVESSPDRILEKDGVI